MACSSSSWPAFLADTLVEIVKHRAGAPQLRAGLEDLRHQLERSSQPPHRRADRAGRPGGPAPGGARASRLRRSEILTQVRATPRPRGRTIIGKMIRSIHPLFPLLLHRSLPWGPVRGTMGSLDSGLRSDRVRHDDRRGAKAGGRDFERSDSWRAGCHMVRLAGAQR